MKKILLALPLAVVLSACVTTQTTNTDSETAAVVTPAATQFSDQWVSQLTTHKAAVRSCIISNKDIQSILYMDSQPSSTVLTVSTKNGAVLDCAVNSKTNNVIKITPRTENLPKNISKFYPVGKRLPDVCKGNQTIKDEEGRLMGTVCY